MLRRKSGACSDADFARPKSNAYPAWLMRRVMLRCAKAVRESAGETLERQGKAACFTWRFPRGPDPAIVAQSFV
jgi:hypothetical protein